MTWLSKNTTITLPEVIAYDDFTDNPVGHEYTLLSHIQGVTLSDLIDLLTQLQAHPWGGIGGLTLDDQGQVQLGTVVDETFWQVPDIEALGRPYKTYVDYITAQYILIQTHEKLTFMRDIVPRLEAFVASLPKLASELNKVKLRLAHRDLHFANMMFDFLQAAVQGEGCTLFEETEHISTLQEDIQRAVGFLRAIAEVSPRG
ncbi:Uncharacterized protein HZ326_16766 [Fusarium oxysporum f. sp. albedinis]|nr:Uncharacterized protein HZ326_16766 [Fusarium oxysporum f. sp. albedinis]